MQVDAALAAALHQRAVKEQRTVSEIGRDALRRYIQLQ
ncbi:MAG: ribbon-helix-helix protein, CopG family [Thermoleophilaceae bacterium]|nr:ribbon-helix-helix protein, CopG family [Thermoleophilaceae bacterium]